jgi:homopolymeric O-antigen transport system permease protein
VSMSTASIADNGGLVKSVFFPRAILPAATVLFNLAQYLLTIVVFLPFMLLVYGVAPAAPMLLFPVFILLQLVFTIGVALTLATATAFFRDIKHLVDVALAALFWGTPIIYMVEQVPARVRLPIRFGPVSSYIAAYHDIFYYRRYPDALTWTIALAYAALALLVGLWIIVRHEERFAELV